MKCVTMEPPLTEPNVQKHNQRLESTSTPKDRTKSRREYMKYDRLIKGVNCA